MPDSRSAKRAQERSVLRRAFGCGRRAADGFADLISGEATDNDVLAQFGNLGFDEVVDRLVGILDEPLFQQANRAVKFVELAINDLADNVGRLARDLRLENRTLM